MENVHTRFHLIPMKEWRHQKTMGETGCDICQADVAGSVACAALLDVKAPTGAETIIVTFFKSMVDRITHSSVRMGNVMFVDWMALMFPVKDEKFGNLMMLRVRCESATPVITHARSSALNRLERRRV